MSSPTNVFEKLTDKAAETVTAAIHLAVQNDHVETTPIHLAMALYNDEKDAEGSSSLFKTAIKQVGGDLTLVHRELNKLFVRLIQQQPAPPTPSLSQKTAGVIVRADALRAKMHDAFIAQDHLLLAVLQDEQIAAAIKSSGINLEGLKSAISDMRKNKKIDSKHAENDQFEALKKYGTDLTALAEEGKLDPVIGRDNEIRRVIRILCRRTKNNPVLIGEPGVGKTAIAEGLALRIVNRDVPASLLGRLFSLDLGALIAGASHKGEHEERIKNVLDEVVKSSENGPGVILFIDEMHLLVDGGKMDAANLLKPLLARGKLRCIGATTLAEYAQHIEADGALERRFSQVLVKEPTVPETINILRGIREKYEVHHGVRIQDPALIAAAELAHRYLTMRRLPDSAIDLVDECCASVRAQRETKPEAIDKLERAKMELNIEIHALEREKDENSKERLRTALKERESIDERLRPLVAAYNTERKTGDEANSIKKKIDELKAKADEAERRMDIATASDIRYYAIPELQKKVQELERKKREEVSDKQMVPDSVTADAIAEVVSRWTGIPSSRLKSTEKQKLLRMERVLSKQVVGQPEAVTSVANAIRLSRSGLANAARPIASFLFAGPSGTGKTLLAKTLATVLFDSPDAMIRIDASEYTEKHSISRLIGSPPGYVGYDQGGQLTDYVRRKPYCILLIDEIEKAAKEVITLFLQVLDDGRLTDSHGRIVDFRNTVIIMTSNLGAAYLNEMPETPGPVPAGIKELVMGAIRGHFVPEFINRIDDIVIFRSLTRDSMSEIVDIRLKEIQLRLNHKKVTLAVDDEAKHYLASAGYNPAYGARPLHRVIQQELLNSLSVMLLDERILPGETCQVKFDGPRNRINIIPNHERKTTELEDGIEIDEMSEGDDEEKWLLGGAKREGERM